MTEQADMRGKMPKDRTRSFFIGQAEIPARPLEPGLYLVATPIGNLGDMTIRGLETLTSADVVACEDTRVTRVLLDRFGISARPYAYHEHNADTVGPKLIERLKAGESVALVSDAGTPLVSDPGYRLAQTAIAEGIRVIPIPGASAPLAALVASGLPNDAFLFGGFLPQKDKARRDRLNELGQTPATLLFFESPNRIGATLTAAAEELGAERQAAVCRELTKAFEEVRRGTLGELAESYREAAVKGEIVLAIGPGTAEAPSKADTDTILAGLVSEMSAGQAASEAARLTGLPRKDLYKRLLALKDGG
ncbi:16S rRNA (cytidine(1402)-2'-O)-methyltransferase [Pseudohoeflea suaedae]|uniref:Ribosomal RNA small subunit methyltransferase I n=2 Tax=Pseudohoeflea suaedae TaxID=877384 RepID=A0A4V3A7B1_9HYPH|nr:16S rRNA (cytidine(1402)-2'-O)-methyltransferase [Pseudohoeflea suaedae]